jgi:hypothetical protein
VSRDQLNTEHTSVMSNTPSIDCSLVRRAVRRLSSGSRDSSKIASATAPLITALRLKRCSPTALSSSMRCGWRVHLLKVEGECPHTASLKALTEGCRNRSSRVLSVRPRRELHGPVGTQNGGLVVQGEVQQQRPPGSLSSTGLCLPSRAIRVLIAHSARERER